MAEKETVQVFALKRDFQYINSGMKKEERVLLTENLKR